MHKKASPAYESTFERCLTAQAPLTTASSLSVTAMFFSIMRLFFHDFSNRRGKLAACAEGRFQRLVGAMSAQFLAPAKNVDSGQKKERQLSAGDSGRLAPLEKTCADLACTPRLPTAARNALRRQSRESGHEESFKMVTVVVQPGSKERIRSERPRSAHNAWKRDLRSVIAGLTSLRLLPKQGKPKHDRFENSVP